MAGEKNKKLRAYTAPMLRDEAGNQNPQGGPSWILMLLLILLGILVAIGISWAFIHPMLHPK